MYVRERKEKGNFKEQKEVNQNENIINKLKKEWGQEKKEELTKLEKEGKEEQTAERNKMRKTKKGKRKMETEDKGK